MYSITLHIIQLHYTFGDCVFEDVKKTLASLMETLNTLQFFKADFGIWLFIIQDP